MGSTCHAPLRLVRRRKEWPSARSHPPPRGALGLVRLGWCLSQGHHPARHWMQPLTGTLLFALVTLGGSFVHHHHPLVLPGRVSDGARGLSGCQRPCKGSDLAMPVTRNHRSTLQRVRQVRSARRATSHRLPSPLVYRMRGPGIPGCSRPHSRDAPVWMRLVAR